MYQRRREQQACVRCGEQDKATKAGGAQCATCKKERLAYKRGRMARIMAAYRAALKKRTPRARKAGRRVR
jgi:hypothetical protein